MKYADCKYFVGQLVRHQLFGYRGVVFEVDQTFNGSDAWYENVARTRPPKDKPWYHVLVEKADHTNYVAERNLEIDDSGEPIQHPDIDQLFDEFKEGRYMSKFRVN